MKIINYINGNIYKKGIFISFKSILIILQISAFIIAYVYIDTIQNFLLFKFGGAIGTILSYLIIFFFAAFIIQPIYQFLVKKIITQFNTSSIENSMITVKKEQVKEQKKPQYSPILYYKKDYIDKKLIFFGDLEYDYFFKYIKNYIKYNETLLGETQRIIAFKSKNDTEWKFCKDFYKANDKDFIYLEKQLSLRIERLKKIQKDN